MALGNSTRTVPTHQTVVQKTESPKWVTDAGQGLYADTKALTADPSSWVYGGPRYAKKSSTTEQALDLIRGHEGAWRPDLDKAQDIASGITPFDFIDAGTGAREVVGPDGRVTLTYDEWNEDTAERFMNPFMTSVAQKAVEDLERRRAIEAQRIGAEAAASGAFGGARHAFREKLFDENTADSIADIFLESKARAYDDASGRYERGRDALFRQQDANRTAKLSDMSVADFFRTLARDRSDLGYIDADALLKAGAMEEVYTQRGLDEERARVMDAIEAEKEALRFRSAILNNTPYDKTATSDQRGIQTIQKPSVLGQVVGGVASAASLLSDPDAKQDITPANDDDVLELFRETPVSTFTYKDAPEAGTRVGPMADDWAQSFGGNGREIDVGQAVGMLTAAVRALDKRTREAA